ncbi:MAG: methionyl-tRNA formyltransferase [Pseudomonadota bacterium]
MKIVFFGTPPFAAASLEALVTRGHEIPLVVTQPDRPAGRGRRVSEPAVKTAAAARGLHVIQPAKMRDESLWSGLRETKAKLFVVAAYGRILPPEILSIPEWSLNVHASLLPRWRGAAPIARAIAAGDRTTGISIMRLVQELDAGDVMLREETAIGPEETCGELTERLAGLGARALLAALEKVEAGTAEFTPQDRSLVTLAPPVTAEEGEIDWKRPSEEIANRVRAFNPWPSAFTTDGRQRIKLFRTAPTEEPSGTASPGSLRWLKNRLWVATGNGWLELKELQREGKARQGISSFLPGYPISPGMQWG